ncbi:MAG: ABC transporter permease, partial [Paracoccus sp. (in: a-proteobacteria)]|nr:ABC transporter permease [Paracoccus sp. (in: a-proteobacteria)]
MSAATIDPQAAADVAPKSRNRAWAKLRRNHPALVGAFFVVLFAIIAFLAPVLPIADPAATNWSAIRLPPSAEHWLGT